MKVVSKKEANSGPGTDGNCCGWSAWSLAEFKNLGWRGRIGTDYVDPCRTC